MLQHMNLPIYTQRMYTLIEIMSHVQTNNLVSQQTITKICGFLFFPPNAAAIRMFQQLIQLLHFPVDSNTNIHCNRKMIALLLDLCRISFG